VSGDAHPIEDGIALALRTIRQPRSGVAAVLATLVRATGADLVAVFTVVPGRRPAMIASAGPGAVELSYPGPADEGMASALQGCLRESFCTDTVFPDPWARYAHLEHRTDRLPMGGVVVLLAAGERPFGGDTLSRVMGPVDLLVHAMEALSRQEAMERELLRSRQDQALLTAGLQHDLRTPLTSILGCAETLRNRAEDLSDPQREELLDLILSQASRLTEMLSESLDHHGADPSAPLRLRPVDPREVAQRVVRAARTARGGEIQLDVESAGLFSDERRVERALLNLVDNALKYGPEGRSVHLVGRRSGESYLLTVADAGPGVSPEVAAAMFTPYVTDPGRSDGTGLGLHSVSHLMQELGGRISYSRKDGWTRFSLALPLQPASEGRDLRAVAE
jgi:signal transduction histidine kinase